MKKLTVILFAILAASQCLMAQEETSVSVTKTTTTNTSWYANPWIWIVGAAVFILLFAAIIRGNRTDGWVIDYKALGNSEGFLKIISPK